MKISGITHLGCCCSPAYTQTFPNPPHLIISEAMNRKLEQAYLHLNREINQKNGNWWENANPGEELELEAVSGWIAEKTLQFVCQTWRQKWDRSVWEHRRASENEQEREGRGNPLVRRKPGIFLIILDQKLHKWPLGREITNAIFNHYSFIPQS